MTRILAVLDPKDSVHLALERCKEQPPESDLDIYAVLFIENASAENFAKTFAEKSEWLRTEVTPYIAEGYKITTEVVPFSSLYETVIETADKLKVDFVVKPMRQHSLFQTMVRTSTDWNLIRHCPHPLLLVSEVDHVRKKPVLAAVAVGSEDDNHKALNDIVLGQALRFAEVLESDTHAVTAWRLPTQMVAVGSIDTTPIATPNEIRADYEGELDALVADKQVKKKHVGEGTPNLVVNETARDIGAGVIVIGTVARTGISGALIGNTAEGVLESTQCDVLVVKLPA